MTLQHLLDRCVGLSDGPVAVAKIRDLILELATQGQLVDQRTGEGTGADLLHLIRHRRPKPHQDFDEDAGSTESVTVPMSWAAAQLADVAEIVRGVSFPGSAKSTTPSDGDVACLRTASVQREIDWDDLIFIAPSYVSRDDQWLRPNDIMISMANSYALVGKVAVVRHVPLRATFGAFLAAIRPIEIDPHFLLYTLRSPRMQTAFRASSSQTTNIANISLGRMRPMHFPLPPLAEQKRIVAKVDELMALCNQLEAQQKERETRHAALARAALTRFADAPTPANLTFLSHRSYDIAPPDLAKTILTVAFKGKLLLQDSSDEPANSLLQISAEQRRMSLADDLTPSSSVIEQECPFRLPHSWRWVRLGEIAEIKHGFAFSSESFTTTPTPFVLTTPGNFHETGGFRDRGTKTKYFSGEVDHEFILKARDLIIPMTEQAAGLLGSPAFVPDDGRTYIHNQRLGKVRFWSDAFLPEFAYWFFNTEFFRGELARTCTGMKVRHTSPRKVLSVPFPVCPAPEQRRIVARVDQLMALVDELEAQLAASRATGAKLLDAIVAELTA